MLVQRRSFFSFKFLVHRTVCLENTHGTHKTHFIYLISQHCNSYVNYCSDHWLNFFCWLGLNTGFPEISFINTFKYLSGSYIMFLHWICKTWSHKNILVWCVLRKIAKSLTVIHLDFVISLYKVTNRGSCISASCNVF